MIGAIIGDIAGSIYEFKGLKIKGDFPLFKEECWFTDDTVMTCAIALSLLECEGNYEDLKELTIYNMHDIGKHYYDTALYGSMFQTWLITYSQEPYNSFGNGSAMRIGAVPYFAKNLDELKELTRKVTEITHNHPEGLKGAEATAVAEWLALNGKSKQEIKEYIEQNYYSLDFDEQDLFDNYKFDGSCQGTVPQCIFAFLQSNSFEDAVKKVISWGGDTDTMGAITGAIAGAFYGVPQDIKKVCRYFLDERMTDILDRFNEYVSNIKNN